MNILKNSTVFPTVADGGIGRAFIYGVLNNKAKKIYISGIDVETSKQIVEKFPQKLFPLKLDVTNTDDMQVVCNALCIKSLLIFLSLIYIIKKR